MENEMKCVLLLSLKEMALRRVAVLLWSDSDILTCISKFRYDRNKIKEKEKEWLDTYEPKVNEKVLNLFLPESLTKQLLDSVRPIGLQIKRWKECQEYHFSDQIQEIILLDSSKLCFTTVGTVDHRKTAEELVSCNEIDVVLRYKLACINCLESSIPLLWEKLPEEKKDYFYNKVPYEKPTSPCLSFCWPHILNGELYTLDYLLRTSDMYIPSFNQWAFEHSAKRGNKTASEYFFQKLPPEDKWFFPGRTARAVLRFDGLEDYEEDMLFYLLTLMTPEEQIRIFRYLPTPVLFCFLDWPRKDLFLENADLFWNVFLPPLTSRCYYYLLEHLIDSLRDLSAYFRKLFQDFFIQSPLEFKKNFVHEEYQDGGRNGGKFLSEFLKSEDSESIKVIFRNLDAADRFKLICNEGVFSTFVDYILCKWHMVEVCLREATLSKGDKQKLKERCMGYLTFIYGNQVPESKFKRLFEFLDEADASANKEKKGEANYQLFRKKQKQMKCFLMLSLKEMAQRKVASLLWSDSEVLASFSEFRDEDSKKEWPENLFPQINDKVLKLDLSELLTEQMLEVVRLIGLQIKRWKECQDHFSDEFLEINFPVSAKLCFTTAGSIDSRKTAEELVCCDVLDIVQRYKLACINCLEDFIPLLWENLPEDKKDYFYNKVPCEKPTFPCLSFCWPHILNGELSTLDYLLRKSDRNLTSFNQWAFEHSAKRGNKTASEYFFRKLPHEERWSFPVRTARAFLSVRRRRLKDYDEDMLFYLLTLMTPEQQIRTFRLEPRLVLFCFLDWPRKDLFLENADLFWNVFLPSRSPNCYHDLYWPLYHSFSDSGPYFRKLFHEFFIQSPLEFKNFFCIRNLIVEMKELLQRTCSIF